MSAVHGIAEAANLVTQAAWVKRVPMRDSILARWLLLFFWLYLRINYSLSSSLAATGFMVREFSCRLNPPIRRHEAYIVRASPRCVRAVSTLTFWAVLSRSTSSDYTVELYIPAKQATSPNGAALSLLSVAFNNFFFILRYYTFFMSTLSHVILLLFELCVNDHFKQISKLWLDKGFLVNDWNKRGSESTVTAILYIAYSLRVQSAGVVRFSLKQFNVGHHCVESLMAHLKCSGVARVVLGDCLNHLLG